MSYWQTSGGRRLKSTQRGAAKKRGGVIDPTGVSATFGGRPNHYIKRGGNSEGLSFGYSAAADPMIRRGIASGPAQPPEDHAHASRHNPPSINNAPPHDQEPPRKRIRDATNRQYAIMTRPSDVKYAQPLHRNQQTFSAPPPAFPNQQFIPPPNSRQSFDMSSNPASAIARQGRTSYPPVGILQQQPMSANAYGSSASFRGRPPIPCSPRAPIFRPDSFEAKWSPTPQTARSPFVPSASWRSQARPAPLEQREDSCPDPRLNQVPEQPAQDDNYFDVPPPQPMMASHSHNEQQQFAYSGSNSSNYFGQSHENCPSVLHYPTQASHDARQSFGSTIHGMDAASHTGYAATARVPAPQFQQNRTVYYREPPRGNDPWTGTLQPNAFSGPPQQDDDPFPIDNGNFPYLPQQVEEAGYTYCNHDARRPSGCMPPPAAVLFPNRSTANPQQQQQQPQYGYFHPPMPYAGSHRGSLDSQIMPALEIDDFLIPDQHEPEATKGLPQFQKKQQREQENEPRQDATAQPARESNQDHSESSEEIIRFSTYKANPTSTAASQSRPPSAPARLQRDTRVPSRPTQATQNERAPANASAIRQSQQAQNAPTQDTGNAAATEEVALWKQSYPFDHNPTYDVPERLRLFRGNTEVDIRGRPLETSRPAAATSASRQLPESSSPDGSTGSSLSGLGLEGRTSLWGNTQK